jgi:SAM-dependent methyltransferase
MMAAGTGCVAADYDALAPFYDAFTAASDYDVWATHVLKLAAEHGLRGSTLLDLACGTGKSFVPFLERGFQVTGSDVSPAMLAEAARKAPHVSLVQADMRELEKLGRFDLVTCFDDSLNYLLDERDLGRALRAIAANLDSSGIALFDLNTLLAYRTTFAHDSVTEHDGTIFLWRGEASDDAEAGCRAVAGIDVLAPQPDGLYARIRTRHVQRHFPSERVAALLAGAGLDCLGIYGVLDDGTPVPRADETQHLKVLYAARRTKGGDVQ